MPWKSACIAAGSFKSRVTASIFEIAVPSEACGARLNETVTAGNWPWCVIDSGCVVIATCANVESGTVFASWVVLRRLGPDAPVPVSAVGIGASTLLDGVGASKIAAVSAFVPAEAAPDDAKLFTDGPPADPTDAPACM